MVDYNNQRELQYALRGTDLVISTVLGSPQINLIDAASRAGVRRFVPAEFEGPPTRRPPPNQDPFDRGRASAIHCLRESSRRKTRHPMQFTVFTCGIFYERFARGGLASKGIGMGTGLEHQGAYLIDIERNTGEVIQYNSSNQAVSICMTAVADLAQFVVAALSLDINNWPAEYRMRGDRRTVTEIINYAQAIKNSKLIFTTFIYILLLSLPRRLSSHAHQIAKFAVVSYTPQQLNQSLQDAESYQNHTRTVYLQTLMATANRQYDFSSTNLNDVLNLQPVSLWDWLWRHWGPPVQAQQGQT